MEEKQKNQSGAAEPNPAANTGTTAEGAATPEVSVVNGISIVRTSLEKLAKLDVTANDLPVGTVVSRWMYAASCYKTTYWRFATYEVTARKRGGGTFLKLRSSGFGRYPYLGISSAKIKNFESIVSIASNIMTPKLITALL